MEFDSITDLASLDSTSAGLGYGDLASFSSMSTSAQIGTAVIAVWTIICRWRMFQKAGLPGWGAIIPFYNIYLRFKMA